MAATHVELLGRERTGTDAGRVGLDHAIRLSDRTGRQSETGADTANTSRARGDERVRAKVEVEHQGVGALDEDALVLREGVVHERDAVDDVRLETLGKLLVAEDLAFGVIPSAAHASERGDVRVSLWERGVLGPGNATKHSLELAVSLEPALDELAELLRKRLLVKQVVHAQTGPTRLGRVSGTDALAGGSDVGTPELDLFQSVDNLVEVEHEVRTVRDEQATLAVQACGWRTGRETPVSASPWRRRHRRARAMVHSPFLVRLSSSSKKAGM